MFVDAKELLERALASPRGIKIKCTTHGEAIRLAHRLNKARVVDRKNNSRIYEFGHPMYNQSDFDRLIVSVPKWVDENGVEQKSQAIWVKIEPRSAQSYHIEEIE
jgi:hypothetical protein